MMNKQEHSKHILFGVLFAKRFIIVVLLIQFWNRVSVKWLEYVKHKQLCSTRRRDKVLMH